MIFEIGQIHKNHSWLGADLVELLVAIDYTGRNKLHKNDLQEVNNRAATSSDEIDEELHSAEQIHQAQTIDLTEQHCEDIWGQLEFRQGYLGDSYPFIVHGDFIENKDKTNGINNIYKFLLATSRLRSFPISGGIRQRWAKYFAEISRYALSSMLPDGSVCKVFDANSSDRKNYYGTDLREAAKILARDIRATLFREEEISSSGDLGIDLVGHLPFNDSSQPIPVWIGQCGAQEKGWPDKILEAHPTAQRAHFHTLAEWSATMFTPVCYRQSNGDWPYSKSTSGIILIDRLRMIELLEKKHIYSEIVEEDWFQEFIKDFSTVTAD